MLVWVNNYNCNFKRKKSIDSREQMVHTVFWKPIVMNNNESLQNQTFLNEQKRLKCSAAAVSIRNLLLPF